MNKTLQKAPQYQQKTLALPASINCIDEAHGLGHEDVAQQRKHFWVNTDSSWKSSWSSFGQERATLWKFLAPVLRGRVAVLDKPHVQGGQKGELQAVSAFSVGEQRGTGAAGLQGPACEAEKRALDISAMGYDQRNLKRSLRR